MIIIIYCNILEISGDNYFQNYNIFYDMVQCILQNLEFSSNNNIMFVSFINTSASTCSDIILYMSVVWAMVDQWKNSNLYLLQKDFLKGFL